ncbi:MULTISPECIES: CpsD/CapB family tyrosine-protein kinase [unclassified Lysobacter]|uniref:CpsD/CapB family tyrosine-protein kinase n=1 Tax=unclassified Lysobacter TaxID=2635362 RepID=UPI001C21F0AE|nr:CpsD/CapB family tyrosine-protein kinase [Lysobacter sp. MMG2]MBU8974925.1 CpsD/CapB family tyrosine-protein kinase [Lysobacter sp. MMG2]
MSAANPELAPELAPAQEDSAHEDGRERDLRPTISRTAGVAQLTPTQLEDRAIIHRGGVSRPEVDAFRELRTRLLSAMEGSFVALVAPVSAGSGGSFVARNLATAMAFDETKSALLVDCDLRHPTQARTMKIETEAGGLVEYLEDPEGDLGDVIYETGVNGLRLIPAGTPREIGAEYFSSVRMRLLLDSIRSRHPNCYVFLDGPPVRGTPDARILADIADVVILVAGYGRDTAASIAQAAANFDPGKFAGVVFNEGV